MSNIQITGVPTHEEKKDKQEEITQMIKNIFQNSRKGTSLMVEWVRLWAPNAGDLGSIPGQGTRFRMQQLKIPNATTKTQHCQI